MTEGQTATDERQTDERQTDERQGVTFERHAEAPPRARSCHAADRCSCRTVLGSRASRPWSLLTLVALLSLARVAWLGCGSDDGASKCETSNDCSAGTECLWVKTEGRVSGAACVRRCADKPDCSASQTCSGVATSCPACKDTIRVCEDGG